MAAGDSTLPRTLRHLLLAWFLLLAQTGALTHGISHLKEQANGHEPVCEQCLAYASLGAGATSTPPAWSPPTPSIPFDAVVPAASPTVFRTYYQSRAPPRD